MSVIGKWLTAHGRQSLVLLLLTATHLLVIAQTTGTASSGGTGWKRIAHIDGQAGRGFGTVSFYTSGGNYTPRVTTITWFHDWSSAAGITVSSDSKIASYWTACRITDDGTNSYLEVNFTASVTGLSLISSSYGWRPAKLYSGTLPAGGGTVRATANVGRLNIENQFMVATNGNVGIGTAAPQAKLAVNGNILAKEVKVKTDISVPDYVFEPAYELLTLAEVEAYVKTNRHLPEIPSAIEIQKNGLDLAEMNLLLLKKIEELTLHLIEKDKEIEQLKLLENRVEKLEGKAM